MLDDGSGLGRRTAVRRTSAERAAIVAESYEPGATVARVARVAQRCYRLQRSCWHVLGCRAAVLNSCF